MKIRVYRDKSPRIEATAFVDATAVVIGDVTIGAHSSLWPMAVARGDVNAIVIGDCTNIQDGTVVHTTSDSMYFPGGYTVTIGNHVTVGHRVVIHGCRIEDYCLIGMSATVMDGAVLEAGLILGAGSLVPSGKVLQGGYLWIGSPARKSRPLTEVEQRYLSDSAAHYVKLKDQYLGMPGHE
ncbi:MAG: gamma carbonic anhydrase family protein [Gammaproteobacteria bacterium]